MQSLPSVDVTVSVVPGFLRPWNIPFLFVCVCLPRPSVLSLSPCPSMFLLSPSSSSCLPLAHAPVCLPVMAVHFSEPFSTQRIFTSTLHSAPLPSLSPYTSFHFLHSPPQSACSSSHSADFAAFLPLLLPLLPPFLQLSSSGAISQPPSPLANSFSPSCSLRFQADR